jgi:hypothetical protein
MKTIKLEPLSYSESELSVMIEILNKYKRRNLYIDKEIVIEDSIDNYSELIVKYAEIMEVNKHDLTKTMIFSFMITMIQKVIGRKRIKEIHFYIDKKTNMAGVILN